MESKKGKIEIDGMTESICTSIDQITAFLNTAQLNKHIGVTDMNAKSSRSHTIMRLTIESKIRSKESIKPTEYCPSKKENVMISVINLVDLAGSESSSYSNIKSKEQKEMKYINTSAYIEQSHIYAWRRKARAHPL